MLTHAFKEWAVICRALAQGKQSLLLRKGGIAEPEGEFRIEHTRFWLYPTYFHQQEDGIKPDAKPLWEEAKAEQPPAGTVRLSHWAEVTGIYRIRDLIPALFLNHLHFWSEAAVEKRFHYRAPGLYVLSVRVYQSPRSFDVVETPEYLGCKSWVELTEALPTEGSTPVLDDRKYDDVRMSLDMLLQPTAYA